MDIKEALTVAIDYEHKVRDHYFKGRDMILDSRGKSVFDTLAREEQGHVDYLESRLAEWHKTGKIERPELPTILPSVEFVIEARKRFEKGHGDELPVQAELDLLKVALDLEKQASSFSGELVRTLPPADRVLFGRFMEIEQAHVLIVQAEIDALAGHGHWFDFQEFRLEAG